MQLQPRGNRGQPPEKFSDSEHSKFKPKKVYKKRPVKTYQGSPARPTGPRTYVRKAHPSCK